MSLRIMTTQISKWRLCRQYNIFFLDTTVKSGYSLFAPTWDMVMGHKNQIMSDEEYAKRYRDILIQSWMNRREEWMKFLQSEELTALACFCKAGKFCHRLLLKDFLQQLCKQLNIPFEYYGELTDTPPEISPDEQATNPSDARQEPRTTPSAGAGPGDSPESDIGPAGRPQSGPGGLSTRPGPIELGAEDVSQLPY